MADGVDITAAIADFTVADTVIPVRAIAGHGVIIPGDSAADTRH